MFPVSQGKLIWQCYLFGSGQHGTVSSWHSVSLSGTPIYAVRILMHFQALLHERWQAFDFNLKWTDTVVWPHWTAWSWIVTVINLWSRTSSCWWWMQQVIQNYSKEPSWVGHFWFNKFLKFRSLEPKENLNDQIMNYKLCSCIMARFSSSPAFKNYFRHKNMTHCTGSVWFIVFVIMKKNSLNLTFLNLFLFLVSFSD